MDYSIHKKSVLETAMKMASSSLTVGTWGNISVRIGSDLMAITPSGVGYDTMETEDIVIVDFDGELIQGSLKPSVECHLHGEIYRKRLDINAIVHTHSTYCTAMAIARKPIPPSCEDLVQIVGGSVEVAPYVLPGTVELAKTIIPVLAEKNAVLMANHGLVAVAKDLNEAFKVAVVCEKSAHATCMAALIGGAVPLDDEDVRIMREFYLTRYGQR